MKFCFIGEAMIEISGKNNDCKIGFAGDTLNTAVHLARYGHDVAYFTAIGTDGYSDDFLAFLDSENVKSVLISRNPIRHMGLYAIKTDEMGERSFQYWRDTSAAKTMFENRQIDEMVKALRGFDFVCYSAISLAILPKEGREKLNRICQELAKIGVKIVYDGNYRPKLWESREIAEQARNETLVHCDIGLPTFDDEIVISGFKTIHDCSNHWTNMGAKEIVVKDGENGCLVNGARILPLAKLRPIDTSGAGDAFNAGYLSARANGQTPEQAAINGHNLAGWVIMNQGAIPSKENSDIYKNKNGGN